MAQTKTHADLDAVIDEIAQLKLSIGKFQIKSFFLILISKM